MNAILEAKLLATTTRTIREESKLWHLSDDHFVAVVEWKLAGIAANKILKLMQKELNLPPAKIPSARGFSDFWSEFRGCYAVTARREAVSIADEVAAEAARDPDKFDAATISKLKEHAFEMALEGTNPKGVKTLFSLVLKARDQDLEERRVKVLEDKIQKATETLTDTALTPEQREVKMKQTFGIA